MNLRSFRCLNVSRVTRSTIVLAVALVALPGAVRARGEPAAPTEGDTPAATASPAPAASGAPSQVENSVVKVFATMRAPDLIKPWAKAAPHEVTGSGVVIDGKRILTNAHVVIYASQVPDPRASGGG